MNKNHDAVDKMMAYCGFEDGAGWANNLLIKTALENGAYGAKLTGAGSGGSVFAIANPDSMDSLRASWETAAKQSGLDNAQIYQPRISRQGLFIERITIITIKRLKICRR